MTCSDVQQVLPDIIDGNGDGEFQLHLKSCPACSELVADLKLIADEARELAESDEPPARVWVQIANQLRAEGIIHEPQAVPARPMLVPGAVRRWNVWWLAPVAVAILAAGSYQLTRKQTPSGGPTVARQEMAQQTARSTTNPQPTELAKQPSPPVASAAKRPELAQSRALPPTRPGAENPKMADNEKVKTEISPPASAEDQEFLSEVSEHAPTMRSTYENQLRAVNAEIRETQEYMKGHPGDMDAHQHLLEVYQQKAMLYQMALDRIQ